VVYRVDRFDEAGFEPVAERLRERMRTLATTAPIPYRRQNGGDYLIPNMQLRPDLGDPAATGFALHLNGERSSRLVRFADQDLADPSVRVRQQADTM
jgi:NAD(P)H dehydrogenase (quinone)